MAQKDRDSHPDLETRDDLPSSLPKESMQLWESPSHRSNRPFEETSATAAFFVSAFERVAMSALRDALRDLSDAAFFDLLESDEAYLLVLDVPGVSPETIDVAVDGGRIRIEARREKSLPGQFKYLEENRSLFVDVDVPLPKDAVETEAAATVDRGVLELRLPKRAETEETRIDVVDQEEAEERDDETGDAESTASADETTPTDEER